MTCTLSDRLIGTKYRPSGFDYLRLCLAISVVIWHTVVVNYGDAQQTALWVGPLRPVISLILPMFFSLSGFLVAGSLERSKTVFSFLYLRAIRIFPALVVETTLSALILGPIFTTFSLGAYFSDASFRHYFLNITGNIHYFLPGVFSNNPLPRIVNYQLWTIPFELQSYIAAAFLAIFGLHRKRSLFLVAVVFLQLVFVGKALVSGGIPENVSGKILVLCFLFGMTLYLFREKVLWHPVLALACLVLATILFYIPVGGYFISLPAAYLTIYLGLLNPRKIGLLNTGDYSYGIYLYGFAIQQAVAAFMPRAHNGAVSLLVAGPLIAGVAFLSWHGVEKHALRARRLLPRIESVLVPLLVLIERSAAERLGLTPARSAAAPEPERASSGQ